MSIHGKQTTTVIFSPKLSRLAIILITNIYIYIYIIYMYICIYVTQYNVPFITAIDTTVGKNWHIVAWSISRCFTASYIVWHNIYILKPNWCGLAIYLILYINWLVSYLLYVREKTTLLSHLLQCVMQSWMLLWIRTQPTYTTVQST